MFSEIKIILAIIIFSGLVGGYAGYIIGPPDPFELEAEKRRWYLRRSLVLGVVATFMVPLFIELIGSATGADTNLLDKLTGQSSSFGGWLVFAGFCLIAAVSGQRFISAMKKRLFEDLIKQTEEIKRDLNDLDEDLREVSTGKTDQKHLTSDMSKTLLKSMYASSERRPNRSDISKLGTLSEEELDKALEELEKDRFVRSKDYDGIKRWRVRSAGKALLS